jgi:hypothetical protein
MKLNAPKQLTWLIALVLGVVGVIASFIGAVSSFGIWIVVIALALLLIATATAGI